MTGRRLITAVCGLGLAVTTVPTVASASTPGPAPIAAVCHVKDFSANREYTTIKSFPDGYVDGPNQVRVTGSSWGTWNPQIVGRHLLFAPSLLKIGFAKPAQLVRLKTEPDTYGVHVITLTAYDGTGAVVARAAKGIDGDGGSEQLRLLSPTAEIAYVTVMGDADSNGLAFTNLVWGPPSCA